MEIPVEIETKTKSWFLSVLVCPEDWFVTSLMQLSQWVALRLKSVTMSEGTTYPRPIVWVPYQERFQLLPEHLPMQFRPFLGFFQIEAILCWFESIHYWNPSLRHHKLANRPPNAETKTQENWEISWPVNNSQYRLLWIAQFLITHPTIDVTSPAITHVRSVRISAMNATGSAPTVPLIKTTPVEK